MSGALASPCSRKPTLGRSTRPVEPGEFTNSWKLKPASGEIGRATDLEAAIREATASLPAGMVGRVVLISDGQPTDSWQAGLDRMTKQGRAQKADRMALAIGGDADTDMLRRIASIFGQDYTMSSHGLFVAGIIRTIAPQVKLRMIQVLHDDATREYAYGPAQGLPDSKVGAFTQALYDEAKKDGWIVISMKNDWKRIFAFEP